MHHRLSCLCAIPSTWHAVPQLHLPYPLSFPFYVHFCLLLSALQIHTHTHTHARARHTIPAPNHNRIPSETPASFFCGIFLHCLTHVSLAGTNKFSHNSTPLITTDWGTGGQPNQGEPARVPENFLWEAKNWHHSFSALRCREKQANKAERDSPLHLCCRPGISLQLLLSGHSPYPFMLWKRPSIFTFKSFS